MVGPGNAFEKGHEAEEEVLDEGVEREGFAEEGRQEVRGVPARGYGILEVVDVGVAIGFGEVSDVAGEGGFTDESKDAVRFGSVLRVGRDRWVELLNDGI